MDSVHLLNNAYQIHENGVKEHFLLVLTEDALYLVNTSKDYSKKVESLFSGVGEVLDLATGGLAGMIGGLTSEVAGKKLGAYFKANAQHKSERKTTRLINNLESILKKEGKNGVQKIRLADTDNIQLKKKNILNRKHALIIQAEGQPQTFFIDGKEEVDSFKNQINKLM
ncbi:MAG: hypothetical protein AAFV80_06730 [Bacteroidota bacterium]